MIINKIFSYLEVLCATNPLYWWKFYRYTYTKKTDKISEYLHVPLDAEFNFLSIRCDELKKFLNENIEIKERIICSANDILNEHFCIFDIKTDKILGEWHKDPITNFEFPKVFYRDVRKNCPQGSIIKNNDIKYPWELSCSHFLVTLAEAYLLTKDCRYEDMFFTYLDDWHKNNPVGKGVTWSCTLDVAMRVVNFIISASIFDKVNTDFKQKFLPYVSSIYTHMLFIEDNLEYGFVRENHYLSDIVGLKMASQCFPYDKKARDCYKMAAKSLREEISYQVCEDGVDHEASTCYHCFCLDLFMIALATDANFRNSLSKEKADRLRKMVRFTEELCKFELYPVVGDNDGERVIDLNGTGSFRKEIVQFGKQVMGLSSLKNEYSFLIDGDIESYNDGYQNEVVKEYHEGGFALVDNGRSRLLLHAGSIGRKGKGGHGHNDQTSFSLDIDGKTFILDPGSMVYERDLQLRHEFRGTAIHNCVMVGNIEQNDIRINRPFKMDHNTKAFFKVLKNCDDLIKISTKHRGYNKRKSCHVSRILTLTQTTVHVEDLIVGNYNGELSSLYTFSPHLKLKETNDCIAVYRDCKLVAEITVKGWNVKIGTGRYSPTYAVMKPVPTLFLSTVKNVGSERNGLTITLK